MLTRVGRRAPRLVEGDRTVIDRTVRHRGRPGVGEAAEQGDPGGSVVLVGAEAGAVDDGAGHPAAVGREPAGTDALQGDPVVDDEVLGVLTARVDRRGGSRLDDDEPVRRRRRRTSGLQGGLDGPVGAGRAHLGDARVVAAGRQPCRRVGLRTRRASEFDACCPLLPTTSSCCAPAGAPVGTTKVILLSFQLVVGHRGGAEPEHPGGGTEALARDRHGPGCGRVATPDVHLVHREDLWRHRVHVTDGRVGHRGVGGEDGRGHLRRCGVGHRVEARPALEGGGDGPEPRVVVLVEGSGHARGRCR